METAPQSQDTSAPAGTPTSAVSRRSFLSRAALLASASVATSTVSRADSATYEVLGKAIYETGSDRRGKALRARLLSAREALELTAPVNHPVNADEGIPGFPGSFSKALAHDAEGNVVPASYSLLRTACISGQAADFAAVPLAGAAKLVSPQAGWAFSLDGGDPFDFTMRAAPSLGSAETAGEMVELYWHALLRDLPFAEYAASQDATAACVDLSLLADFRGPKQSTSAGLVVSPNTLFRSIVPGCLTGPYVSQFLYKDIPTGPITYPQRYPVPSAGADFMTSPDEWLAVQNGAARSGPAVPSNRYLINARDLGEYVHKDYSYQAFLNAALILLGARSPLNAGNPYLGYSNQGGFATFGGPHVLDQVARVAVEALRAAWCQKWRFHRRLRPEEFGGRVQFNGSTNKYGLHADLRNSDALARIRARTGTALLPMAYAEGCPIHPAYPSGHATIAGACTTVLKAFFRGDATVANPVQPIADGSALTAYTAGPLTVTGELNKLAANIAIGRNLAGVHWRTDAHDGMLLGEAVAISCLRSSRFQWNESFAGATFTRFDGTEVTV